MGTYLLCQGGWEGGWYWKRVAKILRAAGHQVFTPTYTGLGERTHLLGREVNLDTHIADIEGVIRCEELVDFVLVGHSYGGMVITGVADKAWQKISTLVYLDAALPADGQSMFDLVLPERVAMMREMAVSGGEGWKIPQLPSSGWSLEDGADAEWIEELSGFHPLASLEQPIRIAGNHLKIPDKVYILATEYDPSPFRQFADWTRGRAGWTTLEIACHHFPMVSKPEETAELLMIHGKGKNK